jgi:outer membrane receptor protein involved in Fe transport
VTPEFRITPDWLLYARFASGYRAGGINLSPGGIVPSQYDPDKTQNYEIGVKGALLDKKLTLDASLYYIDWRNIQIHAINPITQFGYIANGSRAKSEGLELSAQAHPISGMTLSSWISWGEAILTEDFPPATSAVHGVSGDRLPYSSRFSGNVSLRQDFPVTGDLSAYLGGVVSYVGNREGEFVGSALQRQIYPSYTRVDLSSGLFSSANWGVDIYVNNVTDKRGELAGGTGAFPPFAFTFIQPRTFGVSVTKHF